jgi:hypothetical protein
LRDKAIVGTPDTAVSRLRDPIGKLGLDGVLAEIDCGGPIAGAKVLRSLQPMGEEIAPRLR